MRKGLLVRVAAAVSTAALMGAMLTGTASAEQLDKIDVCHIDDEGNQVQISVSGNAWPAHEAHGDYLGLCVE